MMQHFLTSLQRQPDEYDLLDLDNDDNANENNSESIANLWKLEKFSPQLDAHLMLL